MNSKELTNLYKVRTEADLGIRRLTLVDIIRKMTNDEINELEYYQHLDIIFVTNIAVYIIIHGVDWCRFLRNNGIFNNFDYFIDISSEISTYFKRVVFDEDNTKQKLCELSSLAGYLQNDTKAWNTLTELKGLASGGNEHGLLYTDWMQEFKQAMTRIQINSKNNKTPSFMTFYEYIDSGKWITSGSSSIGKVEWEFSKEHGKFKARKNMVMDLYTTDEIYNICQKWDGKLHSKAFIKDEVGKRRLAVASNIEAYLHESYLLDLFGHKFKNWSGITLDESPQTQHYRNLDVMNLLAEGKYALPFDFKRFDHQPTTDEIVAMITNISEQIEIPSFYINNWLNILAKILNSYRQSEITMTIDKKNMLKIS